jgi:hypothetical protein
LIALASTSFTKTSPNTPHTPIWESLAKLHLHETIASFKQMISSDMDHVEFALSNLLNVLINLDFILCIFT